MKLVIQRVLKSSVSVDGKEISSIDKGFLVLLGVTTSDTTKEADFLAEKLVKLRVMADEPTRPLTPERSDGGRGKMNLSVKDVGAEILIVSQFTLYGDTKDGNRPSFINAARPEIAEPIYNHFVEKVKSLGVKVGTGKFGADMKIEAKLDGPVTIIIES